MGRAIIVINRYPPSPNDVAKALELLPLPWRMIRTVEDVTRQRTLLVIEGAEIPVAPEGTELPEYTSPEALIKAVTRG